MQRNVKKDPHQKQAPRKTNKSSESSNLKSAEEKSLEWKNSLSTNNTRKTRMKRVAWKNKKIYTNTTISEDVQMKEVANQPTK